MWRITSEWNGGRRKVMSVSWAVKLMCFCKKTLKFYEHSLSVKPAWMWGPHVCLVWDDFAFAFGWFGFASSFSRWDCAFGHIRRATHVRKPRLMLIQLHMRLDQREGVGVWKWTNALVSKLSLLSCVALKRAWMLEPSNADVVPTVRLFVTICWPHRGRCQTKREFWVRTFL